MAASAEKGSEHSLGAAVVEESDKRNLSILPSTNFKAIPGRGIQASVDGKSVMFGNAEFMGLPLKDIAADYPDVVKAAASIHGVALVTEEPDSPHRRLPEVNAEIYIAIKRGKGNNTFLFAVINNGCQVREVRLGYKNCCRLMLMKVVIIIADNDYLERSTFYRLYISQSGSNSLSGSLIIMVDNVENQIAVFIYLIFYTQICCQKTWEKIQTSSETSGNMGVLILGCKTSLGKTKHE